MPRMKTDPRVDAYIAKAPAFAQPILVEARKRVHKAVPSATETIKWNVPFYVLNDKLVASMAAFKKHTKIGVWLGMKPEMVDVSTLAELLPAAEHAKKLKAAAELAAGAASAKKKTTAKKAPAKKASAKKAAKKVAKQPAKK
jgi:uncharacterized protein YdhG (YjbR/CyaY superfamily)